MGEWRYSSTILGLGTRWRWVVSFTLMPLYLGETVPRYPLDKRLGGPQSRSGRCGAEKNIFPVPGMKPRWASSKPEEVASRPGWRCGTNREDNHRRHRHAPPEKKGWRYACRLLGMRDQCNMTPESRNSGARGDNRCKVTAVNNSHKPLVSSHFADSFLGVR
jgi:hypothetical protein